MATHVTVTWTTEAHDFPFGTTPDHMVASLGGGVPDQDVALGESQMIFNDVPEGDYTASVQLMDATGMPIGDPAMSSQFHVHPEFVSLTIPVGVSGMQTP